MKKAAPGGHLSYSKDASAPTDGYDVGVVVVGETPYAEGSAMSATATTWSSRPPTRPPWTRCAAP